MLKTIYDNFPSTPSFNLNTNLSKGGEEEDEDMISTRIITKKKYVTINDHPLIKSMEKEIDFAKENIENKIIKRKSMELLRMSLIEIFSKSIFIIQQLIKIGNIKGGNENDIINMTTKLRELNNICDDIYEEYESPRKKRTKSSP
jgi:hypothetical protein